MINLTKKLLDGDNISFLERIDLMRTFDVYHAESLRDFLDNSKNITMPFYKKGLTLFSKQFYGAFVFLNNVNLRRIEGSDISFLAYSDSAQKPMLWIPPEGNYFPSIRSFEQISEEEGFKDGDRAFQIYIRYLSDSGNCYILDIQKNPPKNSKPRKVKRIARPTREMSIPTLQPSY